MAQAQGNLNERYNPTGQNPFETLDTYDIQNEGKGPDPSGRGAEYRTFLYDMLKMYYENNWNEYIWNKANDYNSTKNQLKRWTEAGGNPNAFFGGGTNTGNASSITSSSPGNGTPAYGLGMQSLINSNQITKDFWEQRKTKAEAEQKEIENGTLRQINEETIKQIEANTKKYQKEANLTDAQTQQVLDMLPYLKGKTSAEIQVLDQQNQNLFEEGENIKQMRKKLKAETWEQLCRAYIKNWEAWYRKAYGVDPESRWENMIIQFLSGKLKTFEPNEVWNNTKLFLNEGWENTKDFWDMMKEYGLEDFEGDGK